MLKTPRHCVIQTAIKRKHMSPCKGCADRSVGCHSKCEKYVDYTNAIKTESLQAFELYKNERKIGVAEIKSIQKHKKNQNRGRPKKWEEFYAKRSDTE